MKSFVCRQRQLGRLVDDEFRNSSLDPSSVIDYSLTSSSSQGLSLPCSSVHECQDSVQMPERDKIQTTQPYYHGFSHSHSSNDHNVEYPDARLSMTDQLYHEFSMYSPNDVATSDSYYTPRSGLTSFQNPQSTVPKHSAISTPNLSSRLVEGISEYDDNILTQGCDHKSSLSFECNTYQPSGHSLCPQPDELASPVCLSPILVASSTLASGRLGEKADLEEKNREYLIFEARGRQLQEAQQQIALLNEEMAQSERLNNHKDILSKAEIESLTRELEEARKMNVIAENKNKELLDNVSDLSNQLGVLKKLKEESDNKLADLEAKNASLSSELIQLSSGVSLNLAKQRENNLTECLNRRHAMAEEVLQENLEISNRRIANKENELVSLRKDLESERLRCIEMTAKHNELVESLQNKLKTAQERCSELSSSSLCNEVSELRERIKELLTSKKITDDINEILQEELRDIREQLALYEQSLGICSAVEEFDGLTPIHQLPLFQDTKGGVISTILTKTTPEKSRRRSCQSVTFARCSKDVEDNEDALKVRRPSSAVDVPLSSTWNHEIGGTASGDEASLNISQKVTTAHEQIKDPFSPRLNESISALKSELKNTLAKYRTKRIQITDLYERLYAARCDLHKAVAERDRAETARADLQVRVLALEKELNLQPDSRRPSPREVALTGQLERLQADYLRLEAELQTTRTRFAEAQAAEARAAGAERTARERVEASVSEREAAVERTRAACEAHYAAARRRYEAQLTAEHENALAQVKQETLLAREEAMTLRSELERTNILLQEAKGAIAQAVQLTMNEAMKERENDRIRFWREELPHQIELARNAWMLEAEARAKVNLDRFRAEFDAHKALSERQHQSELERLRMPKHTRDQAVDCCSPNCSVSPSDYPLLTTLFSNDLFNELISIFGVESLLPSLEAFTGPFLRKVARTLVKRVADAFTKSLLAVINEHDILKEDQIRLRSRLISKDDNDPGVDLLLKMLGDLVIADISMEIDIVRKLVRHSAESNNTAMDKSSNSESVIRRIKSEVQMYVQACQERCAQTLQKSLSGAHRRACRQMSKRLRTVLVESGLSPLTESKPERSSSNQPIRLSECQIETLLHIIDSVSESTGKNFSLNAINGQPIFSSIPTNQSQNSGGHDSKPINRELPKSENS
ncbi:hypothetical protein Aperf_G00000071414 [Anoplocephala perfoliata]